MDRQSVESAMIASVGFDTANQTMEIEFQSGSVYRYAKVPEPIYFGLISAESKGSFFHREIKNRFSFSQLR